MTGAQQARAKAASSKPTGKIGAQLQAQRKQGRVDTLKDMSAQERRARDVDAAAEALRHD